MAAKLMQLFMGFLERVTFEREKISSWKARETTTKGFNPIMTIEEGSKLALYFASFFCENGGESMNVLDSLIFLDGIVE